MFNVRHAAGGSMGDSNRVLIMLNSHPLNTPAFGGATIANDTLILDNIKRIEIIRGPGSALYGASAFLSVINVITKEAEDIDGLELIARGGSWDTQQYNLLYGNTFDDLDVTFNFNYFKTHGYRAFIEEDFQTWVDQRWPDPYPDVSLAPGRTKGDDEKSDAQITLEYKGLKFDGRYIDRDRYHPVGQLAALVKKSIDLTKDYYLNLSYERSMREEIDLLLRVYHNYEKVSGFYQSTPPGVTVFTPFPNPTPPPPLTTATYPDGMNYVYSSKNSRTGIELQTTCTLSDSNTFLVGATYEEWKRFDIREGANFLPTGIQGVLVPFQSIQEWPDELVMDTEKSWVSLNCIIFKRAASLSAACPKLSSDSCHLNPFS